MKTFTYQNIKEVARHNINCENQIINFFEHYPPEMIEEVIASAFAPVIPHESETDHFPPAYLFYEELNLLLKNCRYCFQSKRAVGNQNPLISTYKNIEAVVNFIKEVTPASYIFCSAFSDKRTDLILVIDRYRYQSSEEIATLLDFILLGHPNINCSVYTFGSMNNFLQEGHLYFSVLCRPENCIYQRYEHFDLPRLEPDKCTELIDKSAASFYYNLKKAKSFYQGAVRFSSEEDGTLASFMLQQTCELTYRSLLQAFRGKQIKCHELVVLRKHVQHFIPAITGIFDPDDEKEIAILTVIQEAYIKSRYDPNYQISSEQLPAFLSAACRLIEKANEVFTDYCEQIKLLRVTLADEWSKNIAIF